MSDLANLNDRLTRVEGHVNDLRVSVGEIRTELKHMPTTAQLWKALAVAGGIVLSAIVGGGWWIVQQWLEPILSKLTQ